MTVETNPVETEQRRRTGEHLDLLAVFHFVIGGLGLLAIPVMFLQMTVFENISGSLSDLGSGAIDSSITIRTGDETQEIQLSDRAVIEQMDAMGGIFRAMMIIFGIIGAVAAALVIYSGFQLRRRKQRTFSMVIAGLLCLGFPLGTVLGVFTLVVLSGIHARSLYGQIPAP